MTDQVKQRIHRIYGCVLAAFILLLGILFIYSCITIYQSGERPFSREVIGECFRRIALPVWITVGVAMGGILLNLFLPIPPEKTKAVRDASEVLSVLCQRVEGSKKEQRLRRIYRAVTAALILLLAVYPLCYFLDISNFSIRSLTSDVKAAVTVALIPTAIAFSLAVFCYFLCKASIRRETAECKAALAEGRTRMTPRSDAKKAPKWVLPAVRCVIFSLAVLLIVLGVWNGGILDVLGKAIRICTECIGLG